MISFPNAKINLGLRVLRKRPDGYHDLDTIFYPVPYQDILEIIISPGELVSSSFDSQFNSKIKLESGHVVYFSSSGLNIEGDQKNNLCLRALKLFDSTSPLVADVAVHLHKNIPTGAGLGGGSSDAAFTLKMLNKLHNFPFSEMELSVMAASLGSDCSFFIKNQAANGTGKGEILEPVEISLKGLFLIIVKPAISVATPQAFSGILPYENKEELCDLIFKPIEEWQQLITNDFEESVFKIYPQIGDLKDKLLKSGAVYSSMSGSGSAVYGLFRNKPASLPLPDNCLVFETYLE